MSKYVMSARGIDLGSSRLSDTFCQTSLVTSLLLDTRASHISLLPQPTCNTSGSVQRLILNLTSLDTAVLDTYHTLDLSR